MVKQRIERKPSLPLELMGYSRSRGHSLIQDDEPETPLPPQGPEIQPLGSTVLNVIRTIRLLKPSLPSDWRRDWHDWKHSVWTGEPRLRKNRKPGFWSKPINGMRFKGQVPHLLKKERTSKPLKKLVDLEKVSKKGRLRPLVDGS